MVERLKAGEGRGIATAMLFQQANAHVTTALDRQVAQERQQWPEHRGAQAHLRKGATAAEVIVATGQVDSPLRGAIRRGLLRERGRR